MIHVTIRKVRNGYIVEEINNNSLTEMVFETGETDNPTHVLMWLETKINTLKEEPING